jgi:hypothetical protein
VGEDVLQAWPENVRLGWKKMTVTNALDYSNAVLVVNVKKDLLHRPPKDGGRAVLVASNNFTV